MYALRMRKLKMVRKMSVVRRVELHGRATYIFGTGSKDEIGYRFGRQFECQIA